MNISTSFCNGRRLTWVLALLPLLAGRAPGQTGCAVGPREAAAGLRWYQPRAVVVDGTTISGQKINLPFAIASAGDGTIVTTDRANGAVWRVQATPTGLQGAILGFATNTVALAAEDASYAAATNTALLRIHGSSLGATLPHAPVAIAYDGANEWITTGTAGAVIRVDSGGTTSSFQMPGSSNLQGIATDGSSIWVADTATSTVYRLRMTDGGIQQSIPLPTFSAGALAFDGARMWVTHPSANAVSVIDSSGKAVQTINVGTLPVGIAFDGRDMWVVNAGANTITVIRACDGMIMATLPAGGNPISVAFDGNLVWVTNPNSGQLSVYAPGLSKVPAKATAITGGDGATGSGSVGSSLSGTADSGGATGSGSGSSSGSGSGSGSGAQGSSTPLSGLSGILKLKDVLDSPAVIRQGAKGAPRPSRMHPGPNGDSLRLATGGARRLPADRPLLPKVESLAIFFALIAGLVIGKRRATL